MELVFEILFEVLLQFGGELLFDFVGRGLKQPFAKRYATHPVVAVIVYALVGAAFGGMSLLVFREPVLRHPGRDQPQACAFRCGNDLRSCAHLCGEPDRHNRERDQDFN